jgi:hypothetical protein
MRSFMVKQEKQRTGPWMQRNFEVDTVREESQGKVSGMVGEKRRK